MNSKHRRNGILLIVASVIMTFYGGVFMMSEGPRPDGGFGWQPGQTIAIWSLLGAGAISFFLGLALLQRKDSDR